MLRPEQIRIHRFMLTNKGTYKAEDVDTYMSEVLASYEQMFRENGELVRKISLLAERVEEYRKDEDNIRAALLTAQRMADKIQKDTNEQVGQQLAESSRIAEDTIRQAEEKAQSMVQEAKMKAETSVVSAKAESARIMSEVEQKAQAMLQEASTKSRSMMQEIQLKTQNEQEVLARMQQETAAFKKVLLEQYQQQIQLIETLPELVSAAVMTPEEEYKASVYTPVQAEPPVQPEQAEQGEAPQEPQDYSIYIEPMQQAQAESAAYENTEIPQASAALQEVEIAPEVPQSVEETQQPGGFRLQLESLDDEEEDEEEQAMQEQSSVSRFTGFFPKK